MEYSRAKYVYTYISFWSIKIRSSQQIHTFKQRKIISTLPHGFINMASYVSLECIIGITISCNTIYSQLKYNTNPVKLNRFQFFFISFSFSFVVLYYCIYSALSCFVVLCCVFISNLYTQLFRFFRDTFGFQYMHGLHFSSFSLCSVFVRSTTCIAVFW